MKIMVSACLPGDDKSLGDLTEKMGMENEA